MEKKIAKNQAKWVDAFQTLGKETKEHKCSKYKLYYLCVAIAYTEYRLQYIKTRIWYCTNLNYFSFMKDDSEHTSTPNVVDELMEDLEASNEVPGEDQMDCDEETVDPTWKPQQLQSEYDKAADDNDSSPREELV